VFRCYEESCCCTWLTSSGPLPLHKEASGLHQLPSHLAAGLINADKLRYDFEFTLLFKWKLEKLKKNLGSICRLGTVKEHVIDGLNHVRTARWCQQLRQIFFYDSMFTSLNTGLQSQVHKVSQFKLLVSSSSPEDEFLNVIGTKVSSLLAIHSHLYLRSLLPPPPPEQKWFETGLKLVCKVNIVYVNLKSENSQDYSQKPQRICTFMNSA
jgi:hypothetical protein